MSAGYYATMGLGYGFSDAEIDKLVNKFTESIRSRGCSHDVEEQFDFCPKCGAPRVVVAEEEPCIEEVIDDLVDGFDAESSTDAVEWFLLASKYCVQIGDLNYSDSSVASIDIPPYSEVNALRAKLKEKLEPLGVWDETRFKFWNVGYCSY